MNTAPDFDDLDRVELSLGEKCFVYGVLAAVIAGSAWLVFQGPVWALRFVC